jgi:hypothetical protein
MAMSFPFHVLVFLAVIIGFQCRNIVLAHSTRSKDQDRKRIEALIAQLRSTNADPNPKLRWLAGYPDDYDFQAQKKVASAARKLTDMGKVAFPLLIEHLNDKAHSRSTWGAVLSSRTVGTVCFEIIEGQVDVGGMTYKSRLAAR